MQRQQFGVGFSVLADRVLVRISSPEDRLAVLAGHPFEESLGLFRMLARRQDAATGNTHERARVLVLEVVQGGVLAVFARLGLITKTVVVVDHTAVDLPGIHRFEHRTVTPVRGKVGFHAFEPFQRGRFALEFQHRCDDGLEVRAGRRGRPTTFPFRIGQVHQRFRQVGFGQLARVVDKYRRARGNAHPFAMGRTIGAIHLFKGGGCNRCEQPGMIDQHHRR
ncbi:hypothetical protein D3C73_1148860 [compost metagenome]